MKATIFEIKRFAVHDGDGIRTTVFFKGCPLECVWCHNPEGLSFKPELAYHENKCVNCGECVDVCPVGAHRIIDGKHVFIREKCVNCGKCEGECLGNALKLYGREMSVDEVLSEVLVDKEFYLSSGGGVTLSGGECLSQSDFCLELLKKLKENNIHTAVDTCGYVKRKDLEKVVPFTDVFLFDIKAIDESVHKKCTSRSNKIILENLKYLSELNKKIEIRVPFVPDYNDKEPLKILEFLKELKNVRNVKVLPYHNLAGSKCQALGRINTLPKRLPLTEDIQRVEELFSVLKS